MKFDSDYCKPCQGRIKNEQTFSECSPGQRPQQYSSETYKGNQSYGFAQKYPGQKSEESPGFRTWQVGPGNQPSTPPPDFTPQLPREGQQLLSGPSDFRGPFGGRIIDFRERPRNLSRCLNRFTYIWLFNGSNFWFYPIFIGRNAVEGFRWRRNRWEYERININRILFNLCF